MKARDIMRSPAITIRGDRSLAEADYQMKSYLIGHLPIVNAKDKLIGIISESDILPLLPSKLLPLEEQIEKRNQLYNARLDDYMRVEVICVTQDTDAIDIIAKLCNPTGKLGFINLVPVIDSERGKKIAGVISWVNLLLNWNRLPNADEVGNLEARALATPISDFHKAIQGRATVAYAIDRIKRMPHRHLPVLDNNKIIAVFSDRDLIPYTPLEGSASDVAIDFFYNQQINLPIDYKIDGELDKAGIYPRYSLKEITVSSSTHIWDPAKETDTVVNRFLNSVSGKSKPFSERLDGLLVVSDENPDDYIGIITPFDCLRALIKKKVIDDKKHLLSQVEGANFLVPFYENKEGKKHDERLLIAVLNDGGTYKLYPFSEEFLQKLSSIEEYKRESDAIFVEITSEEFDLEPYQKIKEFLTEEEKEIINQFILNHIAFKYSTRRKSNGN